MKLNHWRSVYHKLLNNNQVKPSDLVRYFAMRDQNPIIQAQWEAMTKVDAATRTIYFPNGTSRRY